MAPTTQEPSLEERMKAALWFYVGKIVDEETLRLGTTATNQFTAGLTEIVWAQIEGASLDIEAFAKHAGRSTVQTSDVLMLGRRNEGLDQILRAFVESQETQRQEGLENES
ncbi:Histone-fold [Penicillium chermesinum]|uniref:Histone-fold n=1 Tax=Penicillium chermesinum TaxID=63820 RepID=A0A9W9P735_9EURO|nr:Histone-fold [Penicillium chermesinum]KAJ5239060.1 Histone-fold [Penicillium chermesinum]